MNKAILVLDEYPSICRECPLCNTSNDDDYCCDIIGDVDGEYDGIDQRCPIKPMPEKYNREEQLDVSSECFADGYNACIDEILGRGTKND